MSCRSSACCASTGGRPAALSSSPIAPLSAPPPPCGPSLRTAARDGQGLQDTPHPRAGSCRAAHHPLVLLLALAERRARVLDPLLPPLRPVVEEHQQAEHEPDAVDQRRPLERRRRA